LAYYNFGNLGVEFFNVHFFRSIFLLHITTHSNIVVVFGYINVGYQSGKMFHVFTFHKGIEYLFAVGFAQFIFVAATHKFG